MATGCIPKLTDAVLGPPADATEAPGLTLQWLWVLSKAAQHTSPWANCPYSLSETQGPTGAEAPPQSHLQCAFPQPSPCHCRLGAQQDAAHFAERPNHYSNKKESLATHSS